MTYADSDETRKLAGNPSTITVPTTTIDEALTYADSVVFVHTQRTWSTSDEEYGTIKMAAQYIAASFIRDRFGDMEKKAKQQNEYGLKLLELVSGLSADTAIIKIGSHNTWPANSDATPYRSNGGTTI